MFVGVKLEFLIRYSKHERHEEILTILLLRLTLFQA